MNTYHRLKQAVQARLADIAYEKRLIEVRERYLEELYIKQEQQYFLLKDAQEDIDLINSPNLINWYLILSDRLDEIRSREKREIRSAHWKYQEYGQQIGEVEKELENRRGRVTIYERELTAVRQQLTAFEAQAPTELELPLALAQPHTETQLLQGLIGEYEEALHAINQAGVELGTVRWGIYRLQSFIEGALIYGDRFEDHMTVDDLHAVAESARSANQRLALLRYELRDVERSAEPYTESLDLRIYDTFLDYFEGGNRFGAHVEMLALSVDEAAAHLIEQHRQLDQLTMDLKGELALQRQALAQLQQSVAYDQGVVLQDGVTFESESPPSSIVDWKAVRRLYPAADSYIYLNTGAGGCMSVKAAEGAKRYYNDSVAHADIRYSDWSDEIERVRTLLAENWSASVDEIGFMGSLSMAMNAAALMFAEQGGVVLTMADEFPSVTLPWLQRGYTVRFVESDDDGVIPLDLIEASITADTRYLLTSHVQYKTGFRQDLDALGELCGRYGLFLLVDGTQSFGAFPVNMQTSQIAFYAASTYKWTTAGYGVAPFFVRRTLLEKIQLPFVGYRSNIGPDLMVNNRRDFAQVARAIESGHPPIASILSMGGALHSFREIGETAITARILELTHYLHRRLDAAGLPVLSPRGAQNMSGITMVGVGGRSNTEVAAALQTRNIYVAARGGNLRVAVHLYNNEQDIEALVVALEEILG